MHSVLIVIHLIVATGLVSLILLQRSEGGALGMGGGPGGLMSGRAAGNVLTRATTALAFVFFLTSIALTIFTNINAEGVSVIERVGQQDLGAPALAPGADPADILGADQLGPDLLGGASDAPAGDDSAASDEPQSPEGQ